MITHPITVNTKVKATRPRCACKGGGTEIVEGVVTKVITNQGGYWYYLNIGVTVKGEWVVQIL